MSYSITVNTDNATPTPATRDILPLLRVGMGLLPTDASKDANIAYLFTTAMAKYNELAPKVIHDTLTTVAQQASYPLPSDCVSVTDCAPPNAYGYYNDAAYLPMIDTPSSSIFGYSDYAFRSPSERVIRNQMFDELDHYNSSFTTWYVEPARDGNPAQLFIYPPTTTSGLTIKLRYLAHVVDESSDPTNPRYTTLPAGHWTALLRLFKWALTDQRADIVGSNMAITDGGGGRQFSQSWQLSNRADRLIEEVRIILGVNAGVTLRS